MSVLESEKVLCTCSHIRVNVVSNTY